MKNKSLIQKAILFAIETHSGEAREGDGASSYILHPLEVGIVTSSYTDDEDIIVAAILHDTIASAKNTKEEIEKEFNPRIAELVDYLTEDISNGDWLDRKAKSLGRLANNETAYVIKVIDTYVDMKDLLFSIQAKGQRVWDDFNASKEEKMKYYEIIIENMRTKVPSDLLEKYISTLKDLGYSQLIPESSTTIGFEA